MATITVERGDKSYNCWNYLRNNGVEFTSYRIYGTTPPEYYKEWLQFDIDDEAVAVECALRFG